MPNSDSYWLKVLKHYEKRRYIQNGLTIPFLVGSRTIVEPLRVLLSIEELLKSFTNSIQPITLMKCQQLGEYVIGILDHESSLIRLKYHDMFLEFDNLYITDDSFESDIVFPDLSERLTKLYSDKIAAKLYSKETDQWKGFSTIDLERLNEITSSEKKYYK